MLETIENKGFEFEFGYQDTFFNSLDFGLNYNFSTLENNVLVVDNQIGYVLGGRNLESETLKAPQEWKLDSR